MCSSRPWQRDGRSSHRTSTVQACVQRNVSGCWSSQGPRRAGGGVERLIVERPCAAVLETRALAGAGYDGNTSQNSWSRSMKR